MTTYVSALDEETGAIKVKMTGSSQCGTKFVYLMVYQLYIVITKQ